MKTFKFKNFTMKWEPLSGWISTTFSDGSTSGYFAGKDDKFHADLLGINANEHPFLHELMHQWVAKIYSAECCPIVWAAAHNEKMPPLADVKEWEITALAYFFMGVEMRHPHEWKAIARLAEVCKVYEERTEFFKIWGMRNFPHTDVFDYTKSFL